MKTGDANLYDALERVEKGAGWEWNAAALRAVQDCARRFPGGFTADEVWETLDWLPSERRALGAVIRRAVSNGLIRGTGGYRKSRLAQRNCRPVQVWVKA